MRTALRLSAGLICTAILALCASTSNLQPGKAELKSAGSLAFGQDGILFVGDTAGASIWALDVQDNKPAKASSSIEIKGINEKIAAMLGTSPDQILINDTAVNPASKNVYMSVSRGRGPDAIPVILRVDAAGKMSASRAREYRSLVGEVFRCAGACRQRPASRNHHLDRLYRWQRDRGRALERRVLLHAALDSFPIHHGR